MGNGNRTFAWTPQMLGHCFWHGLFCFLVKPYLSTAHWEIKTRSCPWPAASEEVPCPCCHQQPLLRHHFTSLLGSCLPLPKISAGLVWGHHSKPQTQRSYTLSYSLPVSCSPDNIMSEYPVCSQEVSPPDIPSWNHKPPYPNTLSCLFSQSKL